jgi:hypothetical protein
MEPDPSLSDPTTSPGWYGEQDENGVDLSLIRESLKLTPTQRLRRADRAWRDTLRLMEHARRNREKPTGADR